MADYQYLKQAPSDLLTVEGRLSVYRGYNTNAIATTTLAGVPLDVHPSAVALDRRLGEYLNGVIDTIHADPKTHRGFAKATLKNRAYSACRYYCKPLHGTGDLQIVAHYGQHLFSHLSNRISRATSGYDLSRMPLQLSLLSVGVEGLFAKSEIRTHVTHGRLKLNRVGCPPLLWLPLLKPRFDEIVQCAVDSAAELQRLADEKLPKPLDIQL